MLLRVQAFHIHKKNHPLISFNLTNDIAYTIIIAVNSYKCND